MQPATRPGLGAPGKSHAFCPARAGAPNEVGLRPASAGPNKLMGDFQLVEKHRHRFQVDVFIGFLAEAVAFVLRGQVPDL